ncbi:MAG: hypothetical protein AB7I18_13720 [Candidatus Berkiella sp.]
MIIVPILGSLFYFFLKFLCYSGYAKYLNHLYGKKHSIWKVGIFRAILGLVVGAALNFLLLGALNIQVTSGRAPVGGRDTDIYFLLLTTIRLGEWLLTVWYFYDRELYISWKLFKAVLFGTVISYLVDLPALLGIIAVIATIC